MVFLFSRVYLLDIVLGILDNYFMWLSIELVDDGNLIPFSVFNPPALKPEALDVIWKL